MQETKTSRENVSVIVNFLNDLMFLDHRTMDSMMKSRFVCNKGLADSHLVMVKESEEDIPEFTVSFRGMISAIGDILGDQILSVYDLETQQLLGFRATSQTTEDIKILSQDQRAYVLPGTLALNIAPQTESSSPREILDAGTETDN
jgi:hypothetical protein